MDDQWSVAKSEGFMHSRMNVKAIADMWLIIMISYCCHTVDADFPTLPPYQLQPGSHLSHNTTPK